MNYTPIPMAHFISYIDDSPSNSVTPVEDVIRREGGITPFQWSLLVDVYHQLREFTDERPYYYIIWE